MQSGRTADGKNLEVNFQIPIGICAETCLGVYE